MTVLIPHQKGKRRARRKERGREERRCKTGWVEKKRSEVKGKWEGKKQEDRAGEGTGRKERNKNGERVKKRKEMGWIREKVDWTKGRKLPTVWAGVAA